MWHTGINSVVIASPKLAISRRSNEKNSKKKKKKNVLCTNIIIQVSIEIINITILRTLQHVQVKS